MILQNSTLQVDSRLADLILDTEQLSYDSEPASKNKSESTSSRHSEPHINQPFLTQSEQLTSMLEASDAHNISRALNRISALSESHPLPAAVSLVPVVCANVVNWSDNLQISAGRSLAHFLKQNIPSTAILHICDAAINILQTCSSESAFLLWIDILIIAIPLANLADHSFHMEQTLHIVERFAYHSRSIYRKQAARIIIPLAESLPLSVLEKVIAPIVIDLICDRESPVRNLAADSCSILLQVLHDTHVEASIWSCLEGLIRDTDARIHATALRSLSTIVKAFRRDKASPSSKTFAPKLFLYECEFAAKLDFSSPRRRAGFDTCVLLRTFAEEFGPLMHALYDELNVDQQGEIFAAYTNISNFKKPMVRRACALNFPAFCFYFGNRFPMELAQLVESWASDDDSQTRLNMAASLHPSIRYLESERAREFVLASFRHLSKDENFEIRTMVLTGLPDLFSGLLENRSQANILLAVSLFKPLRDAAVDMPWRTQVDLLSDVSKVLDILPASMLSPRVLPFLTDMATGTCHGVRSAAMTVIASMLWKVRPLETRNTEIARFVMGWSQATTHWKRVCLIDCARAALQVFDRDVFQSLFLTHLMHLSLDAVPNVRLRLARLMPELLYDFLNNSSFKSAAVILSTDSDVDVRNEFFSRMGEEKSKSLLQCSSSTPNSSRLHSSDVSDSEVNIVEDPNDGCVRDEDSSASRSKMVPTKLPGIKTDICNNFDKSEELTEGQTGKKSFASTHVSGSSEMSCDEDDSFDVKLQEDIQKGLEAMNERNHTVDKALSPSDGRSNSGTAEKATKKRITGNNNDVVRFVDDILDTYMSEEASERSAISLDSTDLDEEELCGDLPDLKTASPHSKKTEIMAIDLKVAKRSNSGSSVKSAEMKEVELYDDDVRQGDTEISKSCDFSRGPAPNSPVSVVVDKVANVETVLQTAIV